MAFDQGLAERLRDILGERPDVTEKKMFGGLAFMLNGHMAIGVAGDRLMARIGPEAYQEALRRPHVKEMDFTGKPMKGYVFVSPEGIESDAALEAWTGMCMQFVGSLPPK